MKTRNTQQKEIVLSTLCHMRNHPTSGMVYEQVKMEHPTISRSTVFRILSQQAELGNIRRIAMSDSPVRYDFNRHPHYHVRCRECGAMEDLDMPYLSDLTERARKGTGYWVDEHEIEFTGFCRGCAGQGADDSNCE